MTGYYEKEQLWGKPPLRYQIETKRDILKIIPENIGSILDIGCGDGFITNDLPDSMHVVGLDISSEAIRYLKKEAVLGDLLSLPFHDDSFDLVMMNDVIEHIPSPSWNQVISEISRVAKKYLIVTLPFMENFSAGLVTCKNCKKTYHINQHQGSFALTDIREITDEHNLGIISCILTGDIHNGPDLFTDTRAYLNALQIGDIVTICPHCGSDKIISHPEYQGIDATFEMAEIMAFTAGSYLKVRNLRSECIAIFSVSDEFLENRETFFSNTSIDDTISCINIPGNSLSFPSPYIFQKKGLQLFPEIPYVIGGELSPTGLLIHSTERVIVAFPGCSLIKDNKMILTIHGKSKGKSSIRISPYHPVFSYLPGNIQDCEDTFTVNFPLSGWEASRYGLLVEIIIPFGDVVIYDISHAYDNCSTDVFFPGSETDFVLIDSSKHILLSVPFYSGLIVYEPWMNVSSGLIDQSHRSSEEDVQRFIVSAIAKNIDEIYNLSRKKHEEYILLQDKHNSLQVQHSQINIALITLQNQHRELENQHRELENQHRELENQHRELENQHRELENQHRELENQHRELEKGFNIFVNKYEKSVSFRMNRSIRSFPSMVHTYLLAFLKKILNSCGCGQYVETPDYDSSILSKAHSETTLSSFPIDSHPTFLMICHDQDIDRRILQQIDVLMENGWKGTLVCLSHNDKDHIEEKWSKAHQSLDEQDDKNRLSLVIHRIGLDRIVPDCPVYWDYHHRQRVINWWGRSHRAFSSLNWKVYRAHLFLHYRSRFIGCPTPFDIAFYQAAIQYPADIIFGHDLPALKTASKIAQERGIPLVYDAHELYYEQRVFSDRQKKMMFDLEKDLIKKCNLVFTVNQSIAEEMGRRYECRTPEVLLNVTDPVSGSQNTQNSLRNFFNLPPGKTIILFQGGIIQSRNLDNLVRSMQYITSNNVVLILMGNGFILDSLKKIVIGKKLTEKVYFKDAVPQNELLSWTMSADWGIIPYPPLDLNTYFCTPNKLFEFIQAGIPIIANDLPELRRFVHDTGFGIVGKMETPKDIAACIDRVMKDPSIHSACKRKIEERKNEFSWKSASIPYVEKIYDIYNELG